jgi:hypothetical protein
VTYKLPFNVLFIQYLIVFRICTDIIDAQWLPRTRHELHADGFFMSHIEKASGFNSQNTIGLLDGWWVLALQLDWRLDGFISWPRMVLL